ncbi:MAG: hypothetical protein IJW70_00775, partial [Clostridia bacterium]|nr:hypothetical protein [Clostridia bacterium]
FAAPPAAGRLIYASAFVDLSARMKVFWVPLPIAHPRGAVAQRKASPLREVPRSGGGGSYTDAPSTKAKHEKATTYVMANFFFC